MSTVFTTTTMIDGKRYRLTLEGEGLGPAEPNRHSTALAAAHAALAEAGISDPGPLDRKIRELAKKRDVAVKWPANEKALAEAEAKLAVMTEDRDAVATLLERERNALARLRAKHGQVSSRLAEARAQLASTSSESSRYEQALVRAMARRCGLEDPDAFAAHVAAARFPGPTGTGRTTRMLLEALVAAEAGCKVEVVGSDGDHAKELRDRLLGLMRASEEGEPVRVWTHPAFTWPGIVVEGPIDLRLVDHAAQEDTGG